MELTITITLLIAALIFIVAVLYSTVGHAGASGYLAAMALFGVAPAVMKPTALTLNIIVAIVGTIRFYRAGFFSWRIFWPFAIASIPAAFVGGWLTLPASIWGAAIGLLSGLTGVGGGIFLSPLLLVMGWAKTKETSGVSVTFILVNSIAGIIGHGLFAHVNAVATLPR